MPFGIVERARHVARRGRDRLQQEAVARRRRRRSDVDAKAVDDVAARHRAGRAVGEPGQLVLAGRQRRVGHQLVVARLQRLAVDGADADARDAHAAAVDVRGDRHAAGHGVVRRGRDRRRADREQRPAEGARRAEIEAERLLRVELAGDRRGELAEQAAGVGEVVVLEAQQPGDRAAGDEAVGKGAGDAGFADADLQLRRDRRRRRTATSGVALPPSTSFWPPPRKTPTVPSSAASVVTCTNCDSSPIAWSRWSSRSLGSWPVPLTLAICRFRSAICVVSELIEPTALFSWSVTPVCSESSWPEAVVKRDASSPHGREHRLPRRASPAACWRRRRRR